MPATSTKQATPSKNNKTLKDENTNNKASSTPITTQSESSENPNNNNNTNKKPKYTPGTYIKTNAPSSHNLSGKIWKQSRERFGVLKTRTKLEYEEQVQKKKEFKEMKEIENKIKEELQESIKEEKRKMEQRRRVRIENLIKENKFKPLKQGAGKVKGRAKRITDKDKYKIRIYHDTQGLY